MTKYENLMTKAEKEHISILEIDLGTNKKCGKYFCTNQGSYIIINSNMTNCEKYEVLSEELGHHCTTSGDITNQTDIRNVKQEKRARNWAYEKLVGVIDLVNAFEKGIRSKSELIEYLNITEKFLDEAINHYREKYGMFCEIDNYIIYFEPTLTIVKMV